VNIYDENVSMVSFDEFLRDQTVLTVRTEEEFDDLEPSGAVESPERTEKASETDVAADIGGAEMAVDGPSIPKKLLRKQPSVIVNREDITPDLKIITYRLAAVTPPELPAHMIDFRPLLSTLSVPSVVRVFASLLFDTPAIFISSSLSLLTSCIFAYKAVMFPFTSPHPFIPVLPLNFIDVVCAPFPFTVGIMAEHLDRVMQLPVEPNVLWINLDTAKIWSNTPAQVGTPQMQSSLAAQDPSKLIPLKLKVDLQMRLYPAERETMDVKSISLQVGDAFLKFFAELVGPWVEYDVASNERDFLPRFETFLGHIKMRESLEFWKAFGNTQIFEMWQTNMETVGYESPSCAPFISAIFQVGKNNSSKLTWRTRALNIYHERKSNRKPVSSTRFCNGTYNEANALLVQQDSASKGVLEGAAKPVGEASQKSADASARSGLVSHAIAIASGAIGSAVHRASPDSGDLPKQSAPGIPFKAEKPPLPKKTNQIESVDMVGRHGHQKEEAASRTGMVLKATKDSMVKASGALESVVMRQAVPMSVSNGPQNNSFPAVSKPATSSIPEDDKFQSTARFRPADILENNEMTRESSVPSIAGRHNIRKNRRLQRSYSGSDLSRMLAKAEATVDEETYASDPENMAPVTSEPMQTLEHLKAMDPQTAGLAPSDSLLFPVEVLAMDLLDDELDVRQFNTEGARPADREYRVGFVDEPKTSPIGDRSSLFKFIPGWKGKEQLPNKKISEVPKNQEHSPRKKTAESPKKNTESISLKKPSEVPSESGAILQPLGPASVKDGSASAVPNQGSIRTALKSLNMRSPRTGSAVSTPRQKSPAPRESRKYDKQAQASDSREKILADGDLKKSKRTFQSSAQDKSHGSADSKMNIPGFGLLRIKSNRERTEVVKNK